jgi:hypothetical protein
MFFWMLLASLVPTDRKAQLAAAIGCSLYFVLTLAESTPVSVPASPTPAA